jgi:TonB family protein
MSGHGELEFRVERDGTLSLCRILNSSGIVAMDRSVKNALESSQFLPLPDDYGPSSITFRIRFSYNEAPSGS